MSRMCLAIGMGGLEAVLAQSKSLTGQCLHGGLNVDDIDGSAAAMCEGIDDNKMETAFNAVLFERVMKSNTTGASAEPFESGNGCPDGTQQKKMRRPRC